MLSWLYGFQGLVQVGFQIVYVLNANGQAQGAGVDAGCFEFRRAHLSVCGRGRVGYQGFVVAHVDQMGDQLQALYKAGRLFAVAFERETEYGTKARFEIFLAFVWEGWSSSPG